jgi:pimeloyl-ACP methyl ester carboxylesterase
VGAWLLERDPLVITASGTDAVRYRNLRTGESRRLVPSAQEWVVGTGWGGDSEAKLIRIALEAGELTWQEGRETYRASKIPIHEVPLAFRSNDVTLRGKLLLPDCDGPHPAVVIVHGSGRESAVQTYAEPWAFAANGIAAFVFDKRGTGSSEGTFTMDFSVLADDVVQAVHALRSSGRVDPNRIGLAGYSQGGWVAPLAASRTNIAFLLVAYGMIDSPAAEDRAETLDALRRRGFDEEQLARADEVISAVHRIMASGFREGWSEFSSLKRRYRAEPWWCKMDGFSAAFIRYPRWVLTTFGKSRFPPGLPLHHHSADILGQLNVPMLWLVAGADREAPPAATLAWLEQNHRPNIFWKVYPDADHGMLQFVEQQGERIYTRIVPSYYVDQINWVRSTIGAACASRL